MASPVAWQRDRHQQTGVAAGLRQRSRGWLGRLPGCLNLAALCFSWRKGRRLNWCAVRFSFSTHECISVSAASLVSFFGVCVANVEARTCSVTVLGAAYFQKRHTSYFSFHQPRMFLTYIVRYWSSKTIVAYSSSCSRFREIHAKNRFSYFLCCFYAIS